MNSSLRKTLMLLTPLDGDRHRIGVALFLRALGGIYLIAIVSWWVQFSGLIGGGGLVPVTDYLDAVERAFGGQGRNRWWNLPTLFWLSSADGFLHLTLGLGVVLALLVVIGYAQGPALFGLWMIYLSVLHTGSVFLSFQWDILLVEAGFVAILAAPWSKPWQRAAWKKVQRPPCRLAVFLLWCLLFRLMFFSGWVKVAWPDSAWWGEFDAMTYHYETQPLPTWTAWWMHQLPVGFQKFSLLPMYLVELILPFFIFCGTRLRLVAALGIGGLMWLIAATGNYTFFNGLTAILCLPLIEDRYWKQPWLAWLRVGTADEQAAPAVHLAKIWRWVLCFLLLVLSVISIDSQLSSPGASRLRAPKRVLPDVAHRFYDSLRPFALINGYGLFRTMTRERPEIVIEGTRDGGKTWQTYDLRWKPGAIDGRPRFVAPHQPRLAWQFWFLALEVRGGRISPGNGAWFQALMEGLLVNDSAVLAFFDSHPFDGAAPEAVRAHLYLYRFTDRGEKSASGNWWKREPVGVFFQRSRPPL